MLETMVTGLCYAGDNCMMLGCTGLSYAGDIGMIMAVLGCVILVTIV